MPIKLDTVDHKITELQIVNKDWQEGGSGPVARDLNGHVYFASLSGGRLYKYNPISLQLKYAEGIDRTKDGLVVEDDGTVWVTETGGTLTKVNFSK